jgi:2-polyprenyl-3-methyl-5-hydroxy-6-metoxy-1,4-benzoquinol methylase
MRLLQAGLRRLGILGVDLLCFVVIGQVIMRVRHRLKPTPMPLKEVPILRSPVRHKLFGTPEQIIERSGVAPGMHVLEIGPGSGNFTVALARRVASQGMQGSVTCVEIQPEIVDMLHKLLIEEQVNNVEILQGDAQKLTFPDESFDLVFLATVVGEVPDVQAFFHECVRVLKPGGIVAVTEQISDPDFHMPGSVRKLARNAGLQGAGFAGLPWWIYTARYRKPVAVLSPKQVVNAL